MPCRRHRGDVEEADLLLLGIGDRRAFLERIDVEVAELLASGGLGARGISGNRARWIAAIARLRAVAGARRARDEQGAGIGEAGAGGVGERDPALHVDLAGALVEQSDIIGLPAEPARQIIERRGARARGGAVERHRQSRPRAQIGRQRREDDAARTVEHFDAVADLDDGAAIIGEHAALSLDSAPVAGLVRTSVTVWPTALSISASGLSRSKSKFCSTISALAVASVTVSGRIIAETSANSCRVRPAGSASMRLS
jgi:hypothetical protein